MDVNHLSNVPTDFKLFCMDKWFEHKDEIFEWTGSNQPDYGPAYYFKQHRWLLKAMFKEEVHK
tara:strand:+ start:255 stop:443 length:189 start_codon:yes stop_codon:yes gene_type:complete